MRIIPILATLLATLTASGGLLELPEEQSEMRGETTRFVDPYRPEAAAPNPLFLSSLTNKPWWNVQAEARLPILVTEPVGLTRLNQPFSFFMRFPAGTASESIRVVTPYGKELPSQVRVIDATRHSFEIVALLDRLDAVAQVPLFIYYGSKPIAAPRPAAPDPCLKLEERGRSLALINSRLEAEYAMEAGKRGNSILRTIKRPGAEFNQLCVLTSDEYDAGCGVTNGARLRVLDDGPIRKTVSYGARDEHYTISLYAHSPYLCIASKTGIQSYGFWLPGGDTLNDVLCYESVEGLKRMPIQYTGGNTPPYTYQRLKSWFKEGWFALLDEAQEQGIGWFFDLPDSGFSVQTVALGYWLNLKAPGQGALYVAGNARTEPCRAAYIAWKCPPVVSRGAAQAFTAIEPGVPLFGRDFIRMHIIIARFWRRRDADSAREFVEEVQAGGANYLMYSSSGRDYEQPSTGPDGKPGPALLDELVRECHARGMGFCHGLGVGLNVDRIRDMTSRGVDALWLCDEWGWGPTPHGYYPLNPEQREKFLAGKWDWSFTNFSKADRADFKKRYGAEMPDKSDDVSGLAEAISDGTGTLLKLPERSPFTRLSATDLSDPSELAMFHMLIDGHNLLMDDLSKVAREKNSNVFVTATTSPRNLQVPFPTLNAFNDLESLADSFSSVVLDLYSNDGGWLNSMIKYARGAQGNRRPLLVIGGYSGWDDRTMVEQNLNLQIMFGANSLVYFSWVRTCSPWPGMGATDAFNLIDYTGLGEFAARAWPLEFVGILRDRDEFFAGFARKEDNLYEPSIYQFIRAFGFGIPANVIAAKHLKQELAAPYKLIVVPNNPGISEANAALLRGFVEAGGNLILENATIQNKAMAALAGVAPVGEPRTGRIKLQGVKPPLADWSADLSGAWQPVKEQPGVEVLATIGSGQAGITMARSGKGKVVYIAPRIGPQAASEKTGLALRLLAEHLVGYLPVKVGPADSHVWTTVLTDGNRVAIAAFNHSGVPHDDLTFSLAGFTNAITRLVSIRTGRSYPVVNGKARNVSMPAWRTDYFISGAALPDPQVIIQNVKPINQSLNPGMSFLNLRPLPSKELQARLKSKQPDTIYVGVLDVSASRKLLAGEQGAQALVAELGKLPKIKAESVTDLQPETIAFFDVLVIPNLVKPFATPRQWERNVRAFVEQGGRALLLGRAAGYADALKADDLFPEVGQATEIMADKALQVAVEHPVTSASAFQERFSHDLKNPAFSEQYKQPAMKPGDRLESGFPEYVAIQPGPDGTGLVTMVENGEAVIVAGSCGKGRVVLSGMTLGCLQTGLGAGATYTETVSPSEQKVLINSIYWLGARGPQAKPPAAQSAQPILTTEDQKVQDLLLQIE